MKKFFTFLFFFSLLAAQINVAVAANVSYAIKDLIKDFNKLYPDIKVNVIIGSSGKLTAQIQNNAPYDIFLSANMKYPLFLYKKGFAFTKPVVYAKGALVLFFIKKKPTLNINNLKIAIANPKLAPYGKAAKEFLENKNLTPNLVYTQTITQALSYAFAATDGAFVAKSAMFSPKMRKYKKNWIEVPINYYTPIKQGIVLLSRAKKNKEATAFFSYMLSKNAAKILKAYGYITDWFYASLAFI